MNNIYLKILERKSAAGALVLATVTQSSGSTPRKPGSSALFDIEGLIEGTVGGGISEGRVTQFAVKSCLTKESGYLHFMLNKDIADSEEAICGGEADVLVDAEPLKWIPVFERIAESAGKRESGILLTIIRREKEKLVNIDRYWLTGNDTSSVPVYVREIIKPLADEVFSSGINDDFRHVALTREGEMLCFLEKIVPSYHLIIAGAGHIGKALSELGNLLDFEVTVIDDREEFANRENLPAADHIITGNIGEAIKVIDKLPHTYFVIVTRGHSNDAEALRECIGSDAGYIGMIGSKGKIEKMHNDFIKKNWASEEQWGKIYAPIGLEINSQTVEEIAVSIAAQLVMVRNKNG